MLRSPDAVARPRQLAADRLQPRVDRSVRRQRLRLGDLVDHGDVGVVEGRRGLGLTPKVE